MSGSAPIIGHGFDVVSDYEDRVIQNLRPLLATHVSNLLRAGVPLPDASELVAAMAAGIPDVAAQHPFAALLGPFHSSASVRRMLRVPSKQALDDRRRRWTLLAAKTQERVWVYPAFQFDAPHARVHLWLRPLLHALRGAPRWGAAVWLVTEHPDLDGLSPQRAAALGTEDPQFIARLAQQYRVAVTAR
jgi:hypothetical protein